MDELYAALGEAGMDEEEVQGVEVLFGMQKLRIIHLNQLTDDFLKEYGIVQGGIRFTVLNVLLGL